MTKAFRRICVFCGSASGSDPAFLQAASQFGTVLAERGIEVVFGGGSVGMMGALADAALAAGGRVTGVIPQALMTRELGHPQVTEMHVVDSMHTRKAKMAELSDAFVALPGGFGTFEELFEVITWAQLGFHHKPVGILNVANYFDPLIELIDNAIRRGFVRESERDFLVHAKDANHLLRALEEAEPVRTPRFIKNADQA